MDESRQEALARAAREREAEAAKAAEGGGGAPAAAAKKESEAKPEERAQGVKASCPIAKNAGRVPCGLPVAVAGPGKGICREHGKVTLAVRPVNEAKAAKLARIQAEAEQRARAAKAGR